MTVFQGEHNEEIGVFLQPLFSPILLIFESQAPLDSCLRQAGVILRSGALEVTFKLNYSMYKAG